METNISNPRMNHLDGVYASEATAEDFFSLRDHFAGLAMQSIISTLSPSEIDKQINQDWSANVSYKIADAMLITRSVS